MPTSTTDERSTRSKPTLGGTISKFLAVVVVLTLVAVPVKVLLGKANIFEDNRSYILVSSRPRSLDSNLEMLAAQNTHLGYFRSATPFGQAVLRQFPTLAKEALVLVRASDYKWATAQPAQIESRLKLIQRPAQDRSFLPFLIAGGVGLFLGLLSPAFTRRAAPWILCAMVIAATYRFSHACPTCPIVTVLGVDAALAGLIVYALLYSVSVLSPNMASWLTPAACSGVAIWQFVSVLDYANLCIPCVAIAFGNCLLAPIAFAATQPGVDPVRKMPKRLAATLGMFGIAASGLVFAHGAFLRPSAGKILALRGSGTPRLVGKSLLDLGVPAKLVPTAPCLVVFGLATCRPCNQARLALMSQTEIPVRVFELVRAEDRITGWPGFSVPYSPELFPTTPALVVVNAKGYVLDQFFGWSSDPAWQMTVTRSVKQDLAHDLSLGSSALRKPKP